MSKLWTVLHPIGAHEVAGFAQHVEAQGWDGLMVPDNQCLWGDTFVSMALAGAATSTLLLANGATNPATRHPAVLASAIAWVNQSCNGRAALGIARGDSALAHVGSSPVTIAYFEKYLSLVRRYLTGDGIELSELEPWLFGPPATNLPLAALPEDSRLHWKIDVARPEIMVFATGPKMIAAAARLADRICFVHGADTERLRWAIGVARDAAADAGRDPSELTFVAGMSMSIADDIATARRTVAHTVASSARFSSMHGAAVGPVSDEDRAIYESIARSYDMRKHNARGKQIDVLTDGFIDRFAAVGTPTQCIERIAELHALGIDEFLLGLPYNDVDPDQAAASHAAFYNSVMPALQAM